uniref:Sec-independent protein translocase component TatC n=1 Tax=Gracilaria vermiculophylla TaxID=2608709 RepID=A0A345U905_9FLOR|nr:Sec-independent protein translocase component TatC [Gracilaria vermiculophylla]AXI96941.1 Sec-independent protein translocase component TatC [Gracilaria vermiculophylla]QXU75146.1 Sec-independent protein translocase component TatC [Gracilaria vermiculophylla]WDZ67941.1 Sec-independent protein translocase component TatC [Gracilaria vermiculophylla]
MNKKINSNTEMSIFEHLEELRERIFLAALVFTIITLTCFVYMKNISYILQQPAIGVKFLQLAPGEYLFTSIKVALYSGFLLSSPFIIYQITLFILPGLTKKESNFIIPVLLTSIILFFSGIIFAYIILVPAALKFLISYGSEVVEPIWSFEQYFNFMLLLLFSTGIAFQIPVIQIILGILKIFSSAEMYAYWKYVILGATIVSAIITPSTDPVTQIIMSLAILALYSSGIFILKILNK